MQWPLHLQPRVWATQASRHSPPHTYWWALLFTASMTSPITWEKCPACKCGFNGTSYLHWAAITCNNLMLDIYLRASFPFSISLIFSLLLFPLFFLQNDSEENEPTRYPYVVVVAIDFGTTSSGYAYAFTKEPECIHTMRWDKRCREREWGGGGGVNVKEEIKLYINSPRRNLLIFFAFNLFILLLGGVF